ncbi:MAG TPA: hypothetical protein DEF43_05690 [Chloroflexus aurantiacus]|nr:MAG: MBL fold metallo-hydrolase [Chloroflexota bacterium]HBW66652.1 hypothetical protein [Chloroflexus aurantiacus]
MLSTTIKPHSRGKGNRCHVHPHCRMTCCEGVNIYVHAIVHPNGRRLVDTGITELHPAAVMPLQTYPLNEQGFDFASVYIVVNTHLPFDHCGGNHLFAGKPTMSSIESVMTLATRMPAPFASGLIRPPSNTYWATASAHCFPGCGLSQCKTAQMACRR